MREQQDYSLQVKWSAYSGLLFFWSLVQWHIQNHSLDISEQGEAFVLGYARLGNVVLAIAVLIFVLRALEYRWDIVFLGWWIGILVWTLLWIVAIAMLMIAQGKSILWSGQYIKKEERNQILSFFVPGRVSIKWFDGIKEGKLVRRMKEAEIWRFVIMLIGVLDPSGYLRGGWILLLLIRLCGIMFGKDIIPQDRKLGINSRIVKRGEELFLLPLAMWKWSTEESFALSYQIEQKKLLEKGKMSLGIWFLFLFVWMIIVSRGILGWALWKLLVLMYRLARGMILMSKEQL